MMESVSPYYINGSAKKLKSKFDTLCVPLIVFLSCFALAFITGSFAIQPQGTKAVMGYGLANPASITLASDANNLELNPVPGINDGLASGSHNITVSTNVPTGYGLSLSATTTSDLATTTGTIASPIPLAGNTWGYAVPSTGGFDSSYTTPTPSVTSKWADPSTTTIIKNTNSVATNNNTTIYYGAKIDMSLASGVYTNTVRYTAATNISSIPSPSITSISPASGTTAGGTSVIIVGTGFIANSKSVATAVTVGGVDCTNALVAPNLPTAGQDSIYCYTGAHVAGTVDVVVTTMAGTTILAGSYTYVTPASVTSVFPNLASTIAGTESGPALTIVGTNFTGATRVTIGGTQCNSFEIISDTHIFCKAPNTINTTGNKEVVVTRSSIPGISSAGVTYSGITYPTLQAIDAFAQCSTTAKLYRDTRDSGLYYVKKMPDGKCWMVDNLKYANYGSLSQEEGKYLTTDGENILNPSSMNAAKFVDPGASDYCIGNDDMPTNTNTRCGLLYNWYTATNGTGVHTQNIAGTNVAGSICPANFRLPSSTSNGVTTTSDGTSYDAADFAVLNASMNAGAPTIPGTVTNYYANWLPSGAWGGAFSGYWNNTLSNQYVAGAFWSSTVGSAMNARGLDFGSSNVYPGDHTFRKIFGFAVRCVMEEPLPADVYPTTGWAGDTITITGQDLTNVTKVTIGGTNCSSYQVLSSSKLTCVLPTKTAGTSHHIAITANGTNITPQSTYAHMRITYFNPSSVTVNIDGTTYAFYSNGFTSVSCSAITPNNDGILSTPFTSLVYVRDARNNQTYKIKKMADNKCWMVDNLKYIGTSMTLNNGDHRNNGGTTAYNTVNESVTQNSANFDKAFYNHPTGISYCRNLSKTITNTLTGCGYLYNWYAATNGTGLYAQNTSGANVTGNICPANFRLPSALSDGSTATSNGTLYDAADFAVLNASMNVGSLAVGLTSDYLAGWLPSGAWGGVSSGRWGNALVNQSSEGAFWSSTAESATRARTHRYLIAVSPGSITSDKYVGLAVRCVIP